MCQHFTAWCILGMQYSLSQLPPDTMASASMLSLLYYLGRYLGSKASRRSAVALTLKFLGGGERPAWGAHPIQRRLVSNHGTSTREMKPNRVVGTANDKAHRGGMRQRLVLRFSRCSLPVRWTLPPSMHSFPRPWLTLQNCALRLVRASQVAICNCI